MFLYLIQHGEAKKEEEDPPRGLSDKGIQNARKIAAYAKKMGLHVSEIYHSPKTRAQQTTMIFAEHLKPEKGISQSDNLLPMDDPDPWALRIAGIKEDIMLIGHMPYMARLAGLLLCGDREKTFVGFKNAGIVCLQRFEDGRWTIEWMIVPEIVR